MATFEQRMKKLIKALKKAPKNKDFKLAKTKVADFVKNSIYLLESAADNYKAVPKELRALLDGDTPVAQYRKEQQADWVDVYKTTSRIVKSYFEGLTTYVDARSALETQLTHVQSDLMDAVKRGDKLEASYEKLEDKLEAEQKKAKKQKKAITDLKDDLKDAKKEIGKAAAYRSKANELDAMRNAAKNYVQPPMPAADAALITYLTNL